MTNQTRREFVRTLFVATSAAAVFPTRLLAANAPPPVSPDDFNFLTFGDWGRHGEHNQAEVAAQVALAAEAARARFVVSVGDNFYDYGVASATDPQWQTSFENIYHHPSLQIPWHAILGNHDYNGNCDAQIEYTAAQSRWKMPARYYQQTHHLADSTTADFFYLDTSPLIQSYRHGHGKLAAHVNPQDPQKQIAWFKDALAASQAKWKLAFAHHPIYSGGEHGDCPDLIRDILPLLHEHKVQAWFNGHDHDLQHLTAGEVNLFCTGAGSSVRPAATTTRTKFAQSRAGFTTVSLQPDQMRIRMTDLHGQVLYHTTVPAKSQA